jgi:hypothetical protein
MIAAIAVDSRSAKDNRYSYLRCEFDAAYKNMMESSREFNAILMNVTAELSPEQRRAQANQAAQVYEHARERFMAAVTTLHEFTICQIVSSRSTIQLIASANSALRAAAR